MQKQKRTATIPCRDCQAEIGFVLTKKGKNMPVESESLDDQDVEMLTRGEKVDYRHGDHVPH